MNTTPHFDKYEKPPYGRWKRTGSGGGGGYYTVAYQWESVPLKSLDFPPPDPNDKKD